MVGESPRNRALICHHEHLADAKKRRYEVAYRLIGITVCGRIIVREENMPRHRLPRLPQLLERKIYKTGQTRGADDDVLYQNRVGRNSTVLIPYACADLCSAEAVGIDGYENGFIVLVTPEEYFGAENIHDGLQARGLQVGVNAIIFYETREHWNQYNPIERNLRPAISRVHPLGGEFAARVPATTAATDGGRISHGFNTTTIKGAGIRAYEYASQETIASCRLQLQALYWLCRDSEEISVACGMDRAGVAELKAHILLQSAQAGLLDYDRLQDVRILNRERKTICPLCLEELTAAGFMNRLEQAAGRVVPDLTVTQLNLFHITELRYGVLNHKPYNLGWGHHHCNVVVKDSGITETLQWMIGVLNRNRDLGHIV